MGEKKLYQKTWFIILMLILFAPVGIFLMWQYTNWNKVVKIVLSVVFGIMFIFVLIGALSEDENTVPNDSSSTQKQEQKVTQDKEQETEKKKEQKPKDVLDSGNRTDIDMAFVSKNKKGITISLTSKDENAEIFFDKAIINGKEYYLSEDKDDPVKIYSKGGTGKTIIMPAVSLESNQSREMKITCEDCKKADDYNHIELQYDVTFWYPDRPSESYTYKAQTMKIELHS